MTKTMKQSIAVFAVIAQLLILLPFGIISVNAEEEVQLDSSKPALNETVVGTVSFQSFNFLGDNASGSDGVDYSTTFYYTDDYFAPSAVNPKVSSITDNGATQNWTMLEDISMAVCSKDFAVASYTSANGDVIAPSSQTWNNTDYSDKTKNVIHFLSECGFSDIEPNAEMTRRPSNNSIGYTLASKEITVWNGTENAKYTLVAVGMRGAGYGAEWASNVTIGDPATRTLPSNGRHYGFDHSADLVCEGIQDYLNEKNITGNVKYWVTGFSRAGAVANLVAGKLTDNSSNYYTTQDDVYGYTWECPQAAKKQSGNVTNYKNIHNIINAMDAVPKVSPNAFDHQRLGVDYVMPYYKNTTSAENTKYYSNMREVLKKVAVGAYNYAGEAYTEDPLISITDPEKYPYNRPMTIYTITPTKLISDAISDNLMENFGTSSVSGSNNKLGTNIYIDQFVDNLINVFLTSKAWVGEIGGTRTALQNRTTFIADYQNDFRNVLGYLLDYSGPAFLGMVTALVDAVGDQMSLTNTVTNAGLGLAFLNFYEYPTSTYKWGVPPFIDPWVGSPSWAGQTRRAVLISEAQPVVKNVIRNMVGDFVDPQGITRTQFENSLDHLVELVVNLYADELSKYNSNYFGTTLHYMAQILSAHEQEVVLSWIMSLDPNHMNRSYRIIEVPKSSVVELYEYRPQYSDGQYDGTIEGKGSGIRVAKCSDGEFVSIKDPNGKDVETLDQRIWVTSSGNNMVIRYPSSLDIRADVTTTSDVPDLVFNVSDYQTTSETVDISAGESQYQRVTGPDSTYTNITDTNKTNAKTINDYNSLTIPMSTRDILHVYSKGTETYNEVGQPYSIDKDIYANVVVEGQFIHDGDETTFASSITDDNGEERTLIQQEEQFTYSSQYGTDLAANEEKSHLGHDFTITVPEVLRNHYVEQYFVTDASEANNDRLSQGEVPYDDPDAVQGSFAVLHTEDTSNIEQVLGLTDQVFHVFYSGSPAAPIPITRIIDFNSKMILATNADEPKEISAENGLFELDDQNNATYQLKSGKLSSKNLVLNSAFASADAATIKGIFGNESKRVKKRVTVVPASSIYFNDQLAEKTVPIGGGSGYNADIGNSISQGAQNTSGTFFFTFYGTGIDVYCTTHNNGGYVSAAVFTGSGENACVKANRVGSAKTLRNYSEFDYYNTPSVSFTGLTAGTYTLKLVTNDAAQYKLDGVRVYNPVQEGSEAESELNKTDDANATYLNLRSVLLNDEGVDGFKVTNNISDGDIDPSTVSGVLFIDDVSSVVTTSNWYKDKDATEETWHDEPGQIYQSQFDVYKANGPKNEIYLNNGQAVTFQLNTAKFDENTKVYIGLSAPKTGSGDVVINGKEVDPAVSTVMDMYYPVDIDLEQVEDNSLSVTVENAGSGVISVTNLKITGVADLIPAATQHNEQEMLNATRALFAPMTMKAVRMAANNGVDPEAETVEPEDPAVTEDPAETEKPDDGSLVIDEPEETATPAPTPSVKPDTPSGTGNTIQRVIQSITKSISSFFKSIFRR